MVLEIIKMIREQTLVPDEKTVRKLSIPKPTDTKNEKSENLWDPQKTNWHHYYANGSTMLLWLTVSMAVFLLLQSLLLFATFAYSKLTSKFD